MSVADLEPVTWALRRSLEHALWLPTQEHQCVPASLLAAPIIRATAPELLWFVAWGHSHCWVESDEGWIVDLTHAQFERPQALVLNPFAAATSRYATELVFTREEETKLRETMRYDERLGGHTLPRIKSPGSLTYSIRQRERNTER